MTETTSVGTIPAADKVVPGSVGQLLSTMEARLVGEDGKDVKEGEAGELVRSDVSFLASRSSD